MIETPDTPDSKIYMCDNKDHAIKLIHYFDNEGQITDWSLYKNNKLISSKIRQAKKAKVWKKIISEVLNLKRVNRILIVGGSDQVISNLLLKYPCNITVIDPCSYLYFNEPFKSFFKIKDFVNTINDKDLEPRKMIALDFDLYEAFEDQCLNKNSFDLILVDNYEDDLYNYSSIYNKEYTPIYKSLLKDNGHLIINHLLKIVDLTSNPLDIVTYPHSMIKDIKQTNKVYKSYLASLTNSLSLIESYVEDENNKLDVYKNSYMTEL